MTDIRVNQTPVPFEGITLDWLLTPVGDLDETRQLQSAVIVAIGTDRRANDDDDLPNIGDDDRRGWWGDLDAVPIWQGWPIGCRLWLLGRAKITPAEARQGATVERIRQYLQEAIQPFIDIKVATRMDIAVARNGLDRIDATVVLYRGPKSSVQLQFADLWTGIA